MKFKKFFSYTIMMLMCVSSTSQMAECKEKPAVYYQQKRSSYPEKYNSVYIKQLKSEYQSVSKDEVVLVALDMMKNTNADFSRKAILGYNLTKKPMKIEFKNLATINESYSSFDALGWKKGRNLYIFLNPRHADAPPAALAALLAHEALHQDEYNSLAEETYAWTMEAAVWSEMIELYPESNNERHPLLVRENTLKQLFEKGGFTNKYIKKTVHANAGYQSLPMTSPGFEDL